VPPGAFLRDGDWSERTQRYQRAQIREHCAFRVFHVQDEPVFVQWLSERVASPNPDAEEFRMTAYEHLREQYIEPRGTERLRRLLRPAAAHREERLVVAVATATLPKFRASLG
jgi:hypothetical protein